MIAERKHVHNWQQLSPEIRAAIDRELMKTRAVEELDREHCRRLATLLGLRGPIGGETDG